MPVEIASAYVSIIPTLKPLGGNLQRIFQPVEQAGQDAGDRAGDNSGKGFLGGFGGLVKGGIVGVALAAGAAFTDAFIEASDVKKSKAKLQGSLGLDPAETEKLGKTAGQLYTQGYGESMAELTDTLGIVKSSLKGVNDVDLQKVTGKALSFASAFDTDVSESISSVNTLLGSGLVTDANQAFDVLTKASQKVPAALRGDIMDASDEYSQFFRTLGFDSNEAFDVLVKGSEKGAFGIDKAGDAIKEFTIRSTDMSASSVAAYEAIGLNAQDMSNSILQGGDVAQGATQKIIDGILGIEDPSKRANTAIALFGTQMEDMNVADIPQFLQGLKGTSGALGDTAGAADKMDAAMGSTSSGFELFWRNIKTNLVDFISNTVLPKLAEFGNWFNQTFGPAISMAGEWIRTTLIPALSEAGAWISEKLAPVFQDLASYITNDVIPAFARFVDWWSTTGWPILEPIIAFIRGSIENLVNVVRSVIDVIGGVLSGDWARVWDGIKGIFSGVWDQILNILNTVWSVIQGVVSSIGPWIGEKISEFAGFLTQKGVELITWIRDGIATGAQKIWDWFTDLGNQVGTRVSTLLGQVTQFGVDVINWIGQGIVNGASNIWTWLSGGIDDPNSLLGGIWTAIKGIGGKIVSIGGNIVGWIAEGIGNAASSIWNALTKALEFEPVSAEAMAAAPQSSTGGYNSNNAPVVKNPFGAGGGIARIGRLALAAGGGYYSAGNDGAVLPGFAPGVDNLHAILSPGEAVMVPEWVRMVGPANVYAMNRAARGNRYVPPGKFLGGNDMYAAGGGVAKGASLALGGKISEKVAEGIRAGKDAAAAAGAIKIGSGSGLFDGLFQLGQRVVAQAMTGAGGSTATGFNPSQDPSSFGWQRAAGIVPYSWSGKPVLGGVAGGTQGLWTSLLNQLVPQIPGGLNEAMYGFENRNNVNNPGRPSFHSYGLAVDINASSNPNGVNPAGIQGRNGVIPMGPARQIAAKLGMLWGGDFSGTPDPMHFEIHVPPSGIGAASPATQQMTGLAAQLAKSVSEKFGFGAASGAAGGPAPVSGGTFIPNVERWRPMAEAALRAFGYGAEWVNPMLWQMTTESSGNPNAINLTDSNARKGTPSKGLLQTIDPTFASALTGTPYANLIPRGPYDPWANLLAAVSYVKRNYGGPQVWNKSVGGNPNPYDTGGWLMPGGQGINLLNKPEAVLRPDESAAYIKHAKAIGSDGAQLIELHIRTNDPLLQTIIDNAEIVTDGKLVQLRRDIVTARARS